MISGLLPSPERPGHLLLSKGEMLQNQAFHDHQITSNPPTNHQTQPQAVLGIDQFIDRDHSTATSFKDLVYTINYSVPSGILPSEMNHVVGRERMAFAYTLSQGPYANLQFQVYANVCQQIKLLAVLVCTWCHSWHCN